MVTPFHRPKEMNQPLLTKEWAGRKPIENYLSRKTLKEEIWMQWGSCALASASQNYAEAKVDQNEKLPVNSSPKQLLIDKVLARRRFDQLVKEKEQHAQNRKLEEDKERLMQELHKLQLQKKYLGPEFIVPSNAHDKHSALQVRIIQIRNNLPAMEDRIQELRKNIGDNEKRLTPYNEDSIFEGAEPYQIRNINMVRSILSDIVEKLMDDYTRRTPDGMDPFTADQLAWKTAQEADAVMKEVMMDGVTNLVMEQFVLEVTLELSSEVVEEFFSVNQMSRSLAFDVIFNAVQEVGKQRQKQSGDEKFTASSDLLITLLLEQQKDRELRSTFDVTNQGGQIEGNQFALRT
ncbi:uncharacterized protein LOC119962921 [Scyliorhinus canicula]|uniref:uncharacterized protein LOC119962921 n=1 Tax=Scyliorhinus canicula TaxID=7830 RepID=UPI0018F41A21|nr:uncharacterized protein LOC119962921 [Scyliorhinus canicula]